MSTEKKTRIVMDVDASIKAKIEENAKKCGLSMTYYLVWCALHEAPPQVLPPNAIVESEEPDLQFSREAVRSRVHG